MLQPASDDVASTRGAEDAGAADATRGSAPVLDPEWRAGRKLIEARRQLGLSLEQIAERIRVRREFLDALEQMNLKLLPGRAYALAFLRSYARELGIDEDAIVDQFQDECALTREGAQPIRKPSSRPRVERPWLAAAVLVVLAAGFVGWRALTQDGHEVSTEAPSSAGAGPASAENAAEAPVGAPRVVEIMAISEAWLEARGPDGTVFLSQTLHPGEVYRPDASPGWTLHARDGGAFELYVNGVSAGSLGAAGMPVLGRSIDEIAPVSPSGA